MTRKDANRYEVIGRYMAGKRVEGYMVRDRSTGIAAVVSRNKVEQLALNGNIRNVTAQNYGDRVVLKGIGCKLSEMPNYDINGNLVETGWNEAQKQSFERIVARIVDGRQTVGYVIEVVVNGRSAGFKELSRENTIAMARLNRLSNARAQMSQGRLVLRGVNCELTQLKTVRPAQAN